MLEGFCLCVLTELGDVTQQATELPVENRGEFQSKSTSTCYGNDNRVLVSFFYLKYLALLPTRRCLSPVYK